MICPQCKEDRAPEQYYPSQRSRPGSWCTPCKAKDQKARYGREWFLRYRYHITEEQYNQMLSDQFGECAICHTAESGHKNKYMLVDHDHACCAGRVSCGKCIRGLLCFRCNTVLGLVQDSPANLDMYKEYLYKNGGG